MSRTIKDMPYPIRHAKWQGRKVPKDWRSRWSWRAPVPDEYMDAADGNWSHARDLWQNDLPVGRWDFYGEVPSDFRRDLNRAYRAKTNQMVREGRYDEIERPRRNAAWLYW